MYYYNNHPRWSDNDKKLGPLIYARNKDYKPFALVLQSGGEEHDTASLRFSILGSTLICVLPKWFLRPYRKKVKAEFRDEKTIERLGRDWYYQIDEREYGFSLNDGFLTISYGRSTMDSDTDKKWFYTLPWTQWRYVGLRFYDLQGNPLPGVTEELVPTVQFHFTDFDGEEIVATTHMEEREWKFGEGAFSWLSWFRKPKISRTLDIEFSSQTGDGKGSWKGGTLGHSITALPGELHEDAFKRYCEKYNMKFVDVVEDF